MDGMKKRRKILNVLSFLLIIFFFLFSFQLLNWLRYSLILIYPNFIYTQFDNQYERINAKMEGMGNLQDVG